MSKPDAVKDAHKVLVQINENLDRDSENLRLVSLDFVKRGDYTAAVIHAMIPDPIKPQVFTAWGFSKRHPEDESERSVGYEFALKRAIADVFEEYRKAKKKDKWG